MSDQQVPQSPRLELLAVEHEFRWKYEGKEVFITGTWLNWERRVKLIDGSARVELPRGSFVQYKFVVDGRWCFDVAQPTCTDERGNTNNVVHVPCDEIGVASFNLRYDNPGDGENAWSMRRDAVVAFFRERRPALCCTQEGLDHQISYICQRAQSYGRVGVSRRGDSSDEFSAILFDREQVSLVESGNFWLSPTPDAPGSKLDTSELPRMATWAVFRVAASPEKVIIACSTHLDHGLSQARERQAAILAERLDAVWENRGKACPVILCGDFNEPKTGSSHAVLRSKGFFDAWRSSSTKDDGGCRGSTFHGFYPNVHSAKSNSSASSDSEHIDWILFKPSSPSKSSTPITTIDADHASVVTEQQRHGSRVYYPSDHFPVMSTFIVH